jgi:uncharacterized membrane-anchored protein
MMKGIDFIISLINGIWRFYNMRQQAMGFAKGIGAGIAAGVAIAAIGSRMRQGRSFKHRAGRTMRNVGELLDNVQDMFR